MPAVNNVNKINQNRHNSQSGKFYVVLCLEAEGRHF
jgi:hypothetical protein